MNEMVAPECGVLVASARTGTQRLATTYFVDPSALEAGVERLLALDSADRYARSAAARAWWDATDRACGERLAAAVTALARA